MRYPKGSKVNCRASFIDPATGNPVDPASVVFRVETPSGVEQSFTYGVGADVVRESAGRFKVAVSADQSGQFNYRFESTGEFQGAAEGSFEIDRSEF